MNKMKPCPFCNSEGQIIWSWCFDYTCTPTCSNRHDCVGSNSEQDEQGGFDVEYRTEEEAITAWNTRPIEDALRARVLELEAGQFRWVPVSKRLPEVPEEEFVEVFVRSAPDLGFKGGNLYAADFWAKQTTPFGHVNRNIFCLSNGCMCSGDSITHWAYIPEAEERL